MSRSAHLALTLVGLLTLAGCHAPPAQDNPPKSLTEPSPAAPSPAPFRPVPPDPTPAPSPTPPAAAAPATPSQPKPKPAAETKATAAPAAAASPAAPKPASLDLNSLEQRLKDTRAIGVFTKLSLKNQVDDLLSELREFHQGSSTLAQPALRQKYDLLILKVLSLLQNGDPPLAAAIAASREAIWQILMDPSKFAKI